MPGHKIVLMGGPDSGKTNYLARLWEALRSGEGALIAPHIPNDVGYVEEALRHLLQGEFAPRSDENFIESGRGFAIPVVEAKNAEGEPVEIVVPDVTGELWKKAVLTCELPSTWMENLRSSFGALLFVRVGSNQTLAPLDWVTTAQLRRLNLTAAEKGQDDTLKIPASVMLCEFLRFLEFALADKTDGAKPRVAILVTAWDILDPNVADKGPMVHLADEYPLLTGRLADISKLDVRVFGTSVVGGDFADEKFRQKFFVRELRESGYVVHETDEKVTKNYDLTLPVAWVCEGLNDT